MASLLSVVAVVPAAGFGQRMNRSQPKQYLKIGKKTILEHTLDKLLSCKAVCHIIVAIDRADKIFKTLNVALNSKIKVVTGGQCRADSVLSALKQVKDEQWVMVHDAVRPCITPSDIDKLIKTAGKYNQGTILALPMVETIKQVENNRVVGTIDRNLLWKAVTPQLFLARELKMSLEKARRDNIIITDEASAIEYNGGQPLLICGRRDNLKITYPEDLSLAAYYLNKQYL